MTTFTIKQIQGASILIAAEAMNGLPTNIAEFLTRSQSDALMEDVRSAAMESLLFSLTNHVDDL